MGEDKARTGKDIERLKHEIDQLFEILTYIAIKAQQLGISRKRVAKTVSKPVENGLEWCRGVLTELKILLEKGEMKKALELVGKALEEVGETNPKDL